jgi:hypothetical protein
MNREEFSHLRAVYQKDSYNRQITRDNRHVAKYNPYRLKKYQYHINDEYVGNIGLIKFHRGCFRVELVDTVGNHLKLLKFSHQMVGIGNGPQQLIHIL